jgi:hypothetical protein
MSASDTRRLEGVWLYGWHLPETSGRWSADSAGVRIPSDDVEWVRIDLFVEGERVAHVHAGGRDVVRSEAGVCELELGRARRPELTIEVTGVTITEEQRARGDVRRMGCFVRSVRYRDSRGEHELDLGLALRGPGRAGGALVGALRATAQPLGRALRGRVHRAQPLRRRAHPPRAQRPHAARDPAPRERDSLAY